MTPLSVLTTVVSVFGHWIQNQFVARSWSSRSRGIARPSRPSRYATFAATLHEGATEGILVTTAEFGPSAQEFATGKPLTSHQRDPAHRSARPVDHRTIHSEMSWFFLVVLARSSLAVWLSLPIC